MKLLATIFILICTFNLSAQYNLVPNTGFENYSSCPTGSGQLSNAIGWINPTTSGTPDYFNSCSSILSVPYCNSSGTCFQYANNGSAYSGIWCYRTSISDLREYLQIQMPSSLINGKCYYVSYFINLINWAQYGCNNLAFNFSVSQPTLSGSAYLMSLTPYISNFNNRIMIDTLNWLAIRGIYIAGGGENYITIGNFNNDAATDTLKSNPNGLADGAYYFIDDISVIPIDSIIGGMPAYAGRDTIISIGDSVFIGQEISNLNCNWFILGGAQIANNTSGIYVRPASPTTYVVEQNLCGTVTYDTVQVSVAPTSVKQYNALQNSFTVYPNPVTESLSVSSIKYKLSEISYTITDMLGKVILEQKTEQTNTEYNKTVDIKSLENGIYFLNIYNQDRLLLTKKIIKQ